MSCYYYINIIIFSDNFLGTSFLPDEIRSNLSTITGLV